MANIKQRLLASSILIAGLGLYLPLYKQIYKISTNSFLEHPTDKIEKPLKRRKPCRKAHTLPRTSSQLGIAISPNGKKIYQLTDNGIKVISQKTGKQKNFDLPRNFPELSWGADIAYDSKRDLVSLVSFGGEGYFYRFDVKKRRWVDVRSLENMDLKSLTYDRASDRYIAWVEDYGINRGSLLFMAGTGELLYQENIGDRLTGFDLLYDRDNEMPPTVEIIAQGGDLALITYADNSVQSIWYYDLYSNTIKSTYRVQKTSKIYSD